MRLYGGVRERGFYESYWHNATRLDLMASSPSVPHQGNGGLIEAHRSPRTHGSALLGRKGHRTVGQKARRKRPCQTKIERITSWTNFKR